MGNVEIIIILKDSYTSFIIFLTKLYVINFFFSVNNMKIIMKDDGLFSLFSNINQYELHSFN